MPDIERLPDARTTPAMIARLRAWVESRADEDADTEILMQVSMGDLRAIAATLEAALAYKRLDAAYEGDRTDEAWVLRVAAQMRLLDTLEDTPE